MVFFINFENLHQELVHIYEWGVPLFYEICTRYLIQLYFPIEVTSFVLLRL